jgi:hypothetical protein
MVKCHLSRNVIQPIVIEPFVELSFHRNCSEVVSQVFFSPSSNPLSLEATGHKTSLLSFTLWLNKLERLSLAIIFILAEYLEPYTQFSLLE